MFPCEGKKLLIHLTARDQNLKDATEFIHRNESTSGKQPGLIQTFYVIFIRPHPPSVSQLFLSKISLDIYWLDCTDGVFWFHFSFQKNQASLKLKYLLGVKEEQQMLQGCLFICNATKAQCTGFWLWFLLFGHYRETPGSSHRSCSCFEDVRCLILSEKNPTLGLLLLGWLCSPCTIDSSSYLDFCKRKSSSTYILFAIDLEKEISFSSLSSSVKWG